ncbi:hypothetical protein PA25_05140 [Pseudoalteromonas sp. A25]|uniref:hypothetical protein n=1 Tax=Pseudoalteromonas sp. A25 TaxID=116092 RepID=UPI0012A290A3|nr:hypothetical protein [Pseudoalteromonas sp. A25]BBN80529.1 hypothetical protein PA25_05140 [Pseudoalteromonas sp. A25]
MFNEGVTVGTFSAANSEKSKVRLELLLYDDYEQRLNSYRQAYAGQDELTLYI